VAATNRRGGGSLSDCEARRYPRTCATRSRSEARR
jgi:hypothetical protein